MLHRNHHFRRYEALLLVAVIFSIAIGAAMYAYAGVFGVALLMAVAVYAWSQAVVRS